jgi:hypothetical protein
MKRLIVVFTVLFLCLNLYSEEVSLKTAKEYADKFMSVKANKTVNSSEICVFQKEKIAYTYLVNYKPEGWAILSADDRASAIIAYSEVGVFDTAGIKNLPFFFWFKSYENQMKSIISSKKTEVHPSWADKEYYTRTKSTKSVDPLINVTWNQGSGFNASCPADVNGPGGHAYAGCVAVAMAQCMSVYKHPTTGSGSHSYNESDYGTQYVDFSNAEYKWDSMGISGANKYVALLLYHLGVSVNMNYGYDGSGAFSSGVPSAIKTYFDYTSKAKHVSKSDYSDTEWHDLLVGELENGRPVYYAGDDGSSGHAFNIDGVSSSDLFHLNWGWSGNYNGYYSLNSLSPGSNNFSTNQEAVVSFAPRDPKPYDITLSNNTIKENLPVNYLVGTLTASDDTPDDIHTFEVIAPDDIFGNPGTIPFAIDSNKLVTTEILKYSTKTSYEIIVKVTDKTGYTYEKSFIIFVSKNPSSDIIIESIADLSLSCENNSIKFGFDSSFDGKFSVSIYDVLGKLIITNYYNKTRGVYTNSISLNEDLKGLFLVLFDFKKFRITKKVVVN